MTLSAPPFVHLPSDISFTDLMKWSELWSQNLSRSFSEAEMASELLFSKESSEAEKKS